jgi:hypothetical protein
MTENELFTKVDELARQLPQDVIQSAKKIRESGVVDIEPYENNYLLPKMMLSAILSGLSEEYKPFDKSKYKKIKDMAIIA